ncbi:putative DnaG-like primase [Pectobacterium phage Peat1]|uniref:Putative DnaG-like primase n=1 Tax=Pectobacterium phage Peat1 TaxID=1654601 RepID=A0A0H3YI07_9CAUD|nr:putative DnaG-like primase [Pectobacterium phage Peat1]AKN21170.1 putative DnaG-like primase [Pectobacterium phage Peat1]
MDYSPLLHTRPTRCSSSAGAVGSRELQQRLAVFGGSFVDIRPEQGDPKDMSLEEIACILNTALNRH